MERDQLGPAISRALATSSSAVEGLGKAAAILAEYTQAEAVQISALDAEDERIVEIYSSGRLSTMFPYGLRRPAHGSSMRIISRRGTMLLEKQDLREASRNGVEDFSVFLSAGYDYLAAAPLLLHGENLGALQMLSSKPFRKDVLCPLKDAVSLIAPYVALFMSSIETAVENRISQTIERVAEAVIKEQDIQGVCEAVVRFAKNSMGIDAALLRVNNPATHELAIEYRHGHLDPADLAGASFQMVEKRLVPLAIERAGPMIIDEGSPEVFSDREVLPLLEAIPSLLIVPLLDKGELLGTLEFYSVNEYAYKGEHLRNVEHVANLLTSAVEQFRLIKSLSRENEIRTVLAEVARQASATDDMVSLVDSITGELRRVIPLDRVTYFMPSERVPEYAIDGTGDRSGLSNRNGRVITSDGIAHIQVVAPDRTTCPGMPDSTCGAQFCIAAKLWSDMDDRPQGWIHLERAGVQFTVEERNLLPEFARHISPAIDTALSHEAELKLAQEQLRAERAEAEVQNQQALNEAKQNFIATMSHELRTPLTSIRAFTDLLNRDAVKGNLTERQAKQLAVVRRNSEWLSILINDLLDLSSIDSGRFELQYEEVEISALLEGLVESFGPIAEVAGHKLEAILPTRPMTMLIDPNRLSQVIGNLLTNAMKFSPEQTNIRMLVRPWNSGAWFYIRDEGPGIPADQQASVFERFRRAKSDASKRARGTGIGLYVSKMIIEGHGGQIGVTSELGSHTTMYFWMPAESKAARQSLKDKAAEEQDSAA